MNIKEFRKKIEGARGNLNTLRTCYACRALSFSFSDTAWFKSCPVASRFNELFNPDLSESSAAFLCSSYKGALSETSEMTNRERRLFYLDMFEQYCISFKVYKEF